jgi:competence protein ComEC
MYVAERAGSSGFTLDAWRRMWAAGAPRALPDVPEGGLACTEAACTLRRAPAGPVAMLLLAGDVPGACAADLRASLDPIRTTCPGGLRIGRFDLWRDGAYAAWLDPGGVRVVSDRSARGARPWVPPPPDQ